jgi:hypothetical protein
MQYGFALHAAYNIAICLFACHCNSCKDDLFCFECKYRKQQRFLSKQEEGHKTPSLWAMSLPLWAACTSNGMRIGLNTASKTCLGGEGQVLIFALPVLLFILLLLLVAAEQRLREVRRKHTGAKADLERLQKEKEKLQSQRAYLDDKWLGLADTCVEAREPQYTYRGCIFEKAAQVDNGAGHETSLGLWKGFAADMSKVSRLHYD